MPSRSEKLLERMRRSQSGWKRTDLDRLYEGFGFVIRPGGNHDKVSHPEFPQLITSLPRHNKVHGYIVKQAIRLIEQLGELEKAKTEDQEGEDDE